jgi:acyl-CoA synthetase (AMP-forming)/AMP-acid ligase II
MATNSDAFVVAFYAALRLGAIFVPINPASAPPEPAPAGCPTTSPSPTTR